MLYNLGVFLLSFVYLSHGRKDFDTIASSCTYDPDAEAPTNADVNNYVIDWLEGLADGFIAFPYAIDKCTSHSLIYREEQLYFLHTCGEDGHAYTQAYNDSSCNETNKVGKAKKLSGHHGNDVGHVQQFQCSGENTYAELHLVAAESEEYCNNLQTIYAGLAACVGTYGTGGGKTKFSVYCDNTATKFEWFINRHGYDDKEPKTTKGGKKKEETFLETTATTNEGSDSWEGFEFSTTMGTEDPTACPRDRYCTDFNIKVNDTCQTIYYWQSGEAKISLGLYGYAGTCTGKPDSSPAARLSASLLLIVFTFVAVLSS